MTAEHHVLFSDMVRRCSQILRAIDDLRPTDPTHAASIARELRSALRSAQAKLSKIQLPTPRSTRWQGIKRPHQLASANGRSDT